MQKEKEVRIPGLTAWNAYSTHILGLTAQDVYAFQPLRAEMQKEKKCTLHLRPYGLRCSIYQLFLLEKEKVGQKEKVTHNLGRKAQIMLLRLRRKRKKIR